MQDASLLRYSRHILLDEIGIEGQERLLGSHAVVIGAGGLGSPAAMYLAAAGVGHITLVDHDNVDLTNLQRQIVHRSSSVGTAKVHSAAQSLQALNPDIRITPLQQRADAGNLDALVAQADVVLDCSDNFSTRHAVNRACVQHAKPLVWGAAIGWDGQISVYQPRTSSHPSSNASSHSPCYACLFPWVEGFEEQRCATMGVFAPLVGIIGSMQAAQALQCLIACGQTLSERLLMLDGRSMQWTELRTQVDAHCAVCQHP